jgi:hypothetical protein
MILLGVHGFWRYQQLHEPPPSLPGALFETMQLLVLHAPHMTAPIPWSLELSRWMVVVFLGFAVAAVAMRLFRAELACLHFSRQNDLAVVCGLTRASMEFIRFMRSRDAGVWRRTVVVIDKEPSDESVRAATALGAHVVVGDATLTETLRHAELPRARDVLVMLPDDALNVQVASQVAHLMAEAKPRRGAVTVCRVQISNLELRSMCRKSESLTGIPGRFDVRFMDVHASMVLDLMNRLPLDGGSASQEKRTVCLVVIGFGKVGRCLVRQATQRLRASGTNRPRIVIVDRKADVNIDRLRFRHPSLADQCELTGVQSEVESPEIRERLAEWCDPTKYLTTVVMCFQNAALATELALRLRPLLQKTGTPLAIRFTRDEGLAELLRTPANPPGTVATDRFQIIPFGDLSREVIQSVLDENWQRHATVTQAAEIHT